MNYAVGDRVYWNNGSRHIPGTVKAVNVRGEDSMGRVRFDYISVEIDAQARFDPASGSILPLRVKLPTWSARLRPLDGVNHFG